MGWVAFALGGLILILPWQIYLAGIEPRGIEKITTFISVFNELKQPFSLMSFLDVFVRYYREELSPAFIVAPLFLVSAIYVIVKGSIHRENRLLSLFLIGYFPFVFICPFS